MKKFLLSFVVLACVGGAMASLLVYPVFVLGQASDGGPGVDNPVFVPELNVNDEYTLPTVDGTAAQCMKTDGNGVVTWEACETTAPVTLAGKDYLTLSTQEITANSIDLTDDVTGALPLANGGTGQTTAQLAINALSDVAGATNEHVLTKDTATGNAVYKAAAGGFADPMTTRGDIIYKDSGGTTTRLAAGTATHVLTSDGTDIGWAAAAGGGGVSIGDAVGSGTSGSVLFVDSSTQLAQDNSNLFWDDTNDYLAIGTISPDSLFHIMDDATPSNSVMTVGTNETSCAATVGTPLGGINFVTCDGSKGIGGQIAAEGDGLSGEMRIVIRTGDDGVLNDTMAFDSDGFVGVGTSDPRGQFHIAQDDSLAVIRVSALGANGQYVGIGFQPDSKNVNPTVSVYADSDGLSGQANLHFAVSDDTAAVATTDTKMMIERGSGNISISETNTSPDTRLDVDGAITQRELSADPSNPDEGSSVMWLSDGTATGDDGDTLLKTTAGGVTDTTYLNKVEIGKEIQDGTSGSVLFVESSTQLAQDNSNLFWDNTNNRLGIGTNSPDTRFSIGSADGSDQINFSHDNANAYFKWTDGTLYLMTTETAHSSLYLSAPNGYRGKFRTYDEDSAEYLEFFSQAGSGRFHAAGSSPVSLDLQYTADIPVTVGLLAAEGETPELQVFGRRTGDTRRNVAISQGSDAADTASFTGVSNYYFAGNIGINVTGPDTRLDVDGAITQRELSADVSAPDEGSIACFLSDGTGALGDDGDYICSITAGGTTKSVILIDFSALP